MTRTEGIVWAIVFAALAALAIPWFMWRVDATVAGLPVWLWWHVGWMVLASVGFYAFGRFGWGVWVETGGA
jgi:hypothetical protein